MPTYKARAFEPVSMSILASMMMPYAIAAAKYAAARAVQTGPLWLDMGMQMLNLLRLPLGVLQLTIGLPFGFFSDGLYNIYKGGIAPFMMIKDFFCVPLVFCGLM